MFSLQAFWKNRKHHLDRMSLSDLTVAYFQYPGIQVYLILLTISSIVSLKWGEPSFSERGLSLGVAMLLALLIYPLAWYLLHRFVLHGQFLYKSAHCAAMWKRIHFDHHQDPNDLRVLFGSLYTTLPTIAIITIPIGALIGHGPGGAAAFAGGLLGTLFYEFCHCIQHLHYTPRSRFLRRIKQLHLLHHFHNEQGNYGITNFFWDRLAGTFYGKAGDVPHSETVFNLGYANEECSRYPWVAQLSENRR